MFNIKQIILLLAASALSVGGCAAEEILDEDELGSVEQALCTSLVPPMSGPTSPGGTVTRSGAYSSAYEAWQAFDGTDRMWISNTWQTPAWIGYEWSDGPKRVTRYAIRFVNGSITTRAPKDWTLQGWNGSSWVTVDTRTNQTNWAGVERREFSVASPGSYKAYRLHITDDNDDRPGIVVVSIGKLELFDCGGDQGGGSHPVSWYMQQVGLPSPNQLGEMKTVEGACDVRVQQGAVTFNAGKTETCIWQHDYPGWQIISAELQVLENLHSRGSWTHNIIARDGQYTATEKELGDKWKAAIDMAASYQDFEAKTKLELEYQRHRELFRSYASNRNTFELKVTANGGLARKSVVHVKGHVKLVRIM